jgi:hypothetical protein
MQLVPYEKIEKIKIKKSLEGVVQAKYSHIEDSLQKVNIKL